MNFFQILILAVIQGVCELLPVSSSAHVIAAQKLMGLDPSAPESTMLLIMLHTGTMFAVIVYFWKGWKRDFFGSAGQAKWFGMQVVVATFCTGVVFIILQEFIKKVLMKDHPSAEIEDLFNNLPLIAGALALVGILIIIAGFREGTVPGNPEIGPKQAAGIGLVQGFCIPFRGFSRSGATISTGLLMGLPKKKLEEFSFALAVVLTPAAIAKEALRLIKAHALNGPDMANLFVPGAVGMVLSFCAGLLALKLLSRVLEGGQWKFFGFYCLAAAAGVMAIHHYKP